MPHLLFLPDPGLSANRRSVDRRLTVQPFLSTHCPRFSLELSSTFVLSAAGMSDSRLSLPTGPP